MATTSHDNLNGSIDTNAKEKSAKKPPKKKSEKKHKSVLQTKISKLSMQIGYIGKKNKILVEKYLVKINEVVIVHIKRHSSENPPICVIYDIKDYIHIRDQRARDFRSGLREGGGKNFMK